MREQELKHKHVVTLHEVYAKPSGNVCLVLDFLDVDLEQIISAKDPTRDPFVKLEARDIKNYAHMLMLAGKTTTLRVTPARPALSRGKG